MIFYNVSLKVDFILANSTDPDDMTLFTVCQSTHLLLFKMKKVKTIHSKVFSHATVLALQYELRNSVFTSMAI